MRLLPLTKTDLRKISAAGLFFMFFLLSVRYAAVYLAFLPKALTLPAIAGVIALGAAVFINPYVIVLLFIAASGLVSGMVNITALKNAPILEFGFSVIFVFWYLKRVLLSKKKPVPESDIECLADIFAALVMLSLLFVLPQYPLDFTLYHLKYPSIDGLKDPFWTFEASYTLLMGIFIFKVTLIECRHKKEAPGVLISVLLLMAVVPALFAAYEILNNVISGFRLDRLMLSLPFTNKNSLGHYSSFFLLFLSGMAFFGDKEKKRRVSIILLALLAGILIMSQSRSAWGGVFLTAAVIVFYKASLKTKAIFTAAVIGMLIFINFNIDSLLNSKNLYIKRIASATSLKHIPDDVIINARLAHWNNALHVIGAYPATGCGIGSFFKISQFYQSKKDRQSLKRVEKINENAHNYFLQIGAELGLTGLVFFALIIGLAFNTGIRHFKSRKTGFKETMAVLFGLTALLVASLADHALLLSPLQIVFWFSLALVVITAGEKGMVFFTRKNATWLWIFGLALCFVLGGGYAYKLCAAHPEQLEYGYYNSLEYKINKKTRLRWTMPMSGTEVTAPAEDFGFAAYAEPERTKQGVIHATVYLNGLPAHDIEWRKAGLKQLYCHVPGITDNHLEIVIKADAHDNPYLSGIDANIRRNRDESIAVGAIKFTKKNVDSSEIKCVTED